MQGVETCSYRVPHSDHEEPVYEKRWVDPFQPEVVQSRDETAQTNDREQTCQAYIILLALLLFLKYRNFKILFSFYPNLDWLVTVYLLVVSRRRDAVAGKHS